MAWTSIAWPEFTRAVHSKMTRARLSSRSASLGRSWPSGPSPAIGRPLTGSPLPPRLELAREAQAARIAEALAQGPHGAEEEHGDRLLRARHLPGQLGRREPLDQGEEDHLAVVGRQRLDRAQQPVEALLATEESA